MWNKLLNCFVATVVATTINACATFPYHTNTGTFNATTNATGDYDAFKWAWNGYDDQVITATFLPAGFSNVYMRMSYPRRGTVFMDLQTGVTTSNSYYAFVSKSNIPPAGVYWTEFVGLVNYATNVPTRVLATGKITVQHSTFQNTNQATWVNPLAGTVIGPPFHTLSNLTNWPFTTTAASGVNAETATNIVTGIAYPLVGNPSNFVTSAGSVDLSFTNNYSQTNHLHTGVYQPAGTYVTAESDPVWQAQSSTVWGAISGKQATGDYATVTALGGYVATGAVGTAAYSNANAFATAAQGARADLALTNETTTLATAAGRGGFAGTETISPDSISISQPDGPIPFTIAGPGSATRLLLGLDAGAGYIPALVSESSGDPTFWRFRNLGNVNVYVASTNDLGGYVATNGSGSSLTGISPTGHLHDATAITNAPWLTNVTPAAIVAAGGATNVSINGTLFTVVNGVATGTVASGSGGITNGQSGVVLGLATNTEAMTANTNFTVTGFTTLNRATTINGNSDAVQLSVRANATQNSNVFQVVASDGSTVRFAVNPRGQLKSLNQDGANSIVMYSTTPPPSAKMGADSLWITDAFPALDTGNARNTVLCPGAQMGSMGLKTATDNTLVGANVGAGWVNTWGNFNTMIGSQAGYYLVNSGSNTLVGANCFGNSGLTGSGSANSALGFKALMQAGTGTGTRNVAIGAHAMENSSQCDINIAIGYRAGYATGGSGILAPGSRTGCVFIGTSAGQYQTNKSYRFVLDQFPRTNATDEANNGMFFGDFAANRTDQNLAINANVSTITLKAESKFYLGTTNTWLFSDGTNLFFRNVNDVTNAITAN